MSRTRAAESAGTEQVPQTRNSGPNKEINQLFQELTDSRAEVRNELYKYWRNIQEIGYSPDYKPIVFTTDKYSLMVNARIKDNETSITVRVQRKDEKAFTQREVNAIDSHNLVLFEHETGKIIYPEENIIDSGKYYDKLFHIGETYEIFKYLKDAPDDLIAEMEKFVPNPWLRELKLYTPPPYLSLVELKE